MDEYILYAVEPKKIDNIKRLDLVTLCELWKGLPPLNFKEKGDALCVEDGRDYIWIPSSTAAALSSSQILRAFGYRLGLHMHFFWVEAQPEDMDYASFLANTRTLNDNQILLAEERERKEEKVQRKRK